MAKYQCFVISPIGNEGTEVYLEYKDLYELIICPALEIYDIEVKRGNHFVSDDKIDDSVIKNIQEADICICDISEPNPNVYYELGRRDETGKPIVLLKKKGTPQSPVDIATAGIFAATQDTAWLDKAIIALKKAISIYEVDFLYSNLAMCYYEYAQEKFEKLTKLSPMDARLLAEELKRQ